LTAAHVTDLADIDFVADPFIVKDGDTYYIFYEVANGGTTTICYSFSSDGLAWTYGGQVLTSAETGSSTLSYPCVIRVDGEWYMMPDCGGQTVRLFKATTFPTVWIDYETLIFTAHNMRDATPFQYNGTWYVLVFDKSLATARLFYAENCIYGAQWHEHPSSPILTGMDNSRPGGRPIVRENSVDMYIQDDAPTYGNLLRAYRLTNLSLTTCTAAELETSPILNASGSGWNADGMHHLDRVDSGLSIVDGVSSGGFSIGIYRDVP